jgi:hypothetical protein
MVEMMMGLKGYCNEYLKIINQEHKTSFKVMEENINGWWD